MPKFIIQSSETVFYENEVECATEEEARDIVFSGNVDFIPQDSSNFEIDSIRLAD